MQRHLSDRLRIIQLFDAYGRLLTDRQQRLLRLYLHDDLSLSEIAERAEVTRPAVYDAGRRRAAAGGMRGCAGGPGHSSPTAGCSPARVWIRARNCSSRRCAWRPATACSTWAAGTGRLGWA